MHETAASVWVKGHLTQFFFLKIYSENVCTANTQRLHWIHNVFFFIRQHTALAVIDAKSRDMQKEILLLQKSCLPAELITEDRNQSWWWQETQEWVVLKAHQAAWSADLRADSLCFAPRNDSTGTDYNKPNIGCACHTMSDSRCILKDK